MRRTSGDAALGCLGCRRGSVDVEAAKLNMTAMSQTILVVDDDPHIRQLLVFALGKAGFGAREADDGEAALASIALAPPDLVVLDINLPRMNGLDVCRRVRAESDLPILFLSSRDDEIDRVLGIELGADDYVVKPFSPREVVARVTAILRRTSAAPTLRARGPLIQRGKLSLDPEAWSAIWGGTEIGLTVTEFSILRTLAAAPSRVFTRDAIHWPPARLRFRGHRPHNRQPHSQLARQVRRARRPRCHRDPRRCGLSTGPVPRHRRVITRAKDFIKRHWPALRLREILLAVLLFAAAMPAIEAVWLRGYENTLVRQSEAELIAQGAALTASAGAIWPGSERPTVQAAVHDPGYYRPEPSTIDLNATPVLAERPTPMPSARASDPAAVETARRMGPIIDQTVRTTLAAVVMVDRQGVVVRGEGLGGDLSTLPEVRSALNGRSQTVLRRNGAYHPRYSMEWLSRASALRLHYARPILVNGNVVGAMLFSRSPRALFRGLYDDLGKITLGAAIIVGLLIGLAGLVSRGITRPIEALSAATRAVAAGGGSIPETPPTAAVEIRGLYEDFQRMADVIARRSRYLRDFAASVSHEFKTPLAGIGGAVEILQDHYASMSTEERGAFLSNIATDVDRLSHLVGRLLDLARADMTRPEAEASVKLHNPARRIADALSDRDFRVLQEVPPDLPSGRPTGDDGGSRAPAT